MSLDLRGCAGMRRLLRRRDRICHRRTRLRRERLGGCNPCFALGKCRLIFTLLVLERLTEHRHFALELCDGVPCVRAAPFWDGLPKRAQAAPDAMRLRRSARARGRLCVLYRAIARRVRDRRGTQPGVKPTLKRLHADARAGQAGEGWLVNAEEYRQSAASSRLGKGMISKAFVDLVRARFPPITALNNAR